MRILKTTLAAMAIAACSSRLASAEQYVKQVNGKSVVVHTSAAPVVLHRLVPPYLGKHVTVRQLQNGRLPPGMRK